MAGILSAMAKPSNKTPKSFPGTDASVRPQDDFFRYANGGWMKTHPIPKNESRWGAFVELRFKTDKQLYTILKELESAKSYPAGSPEQMIRDFYLSGMDMKKRNALGLKPIEKLRRNAQTLTSTNDLLTFVAKLHRTGVGVGWGSGVDQDSKNSDKYAFHFVQGGLGMPDREYYLKNDPESVRVRTAYEEHIVRILKLAGFSSKEAVERKQAVMRIEHTLALASMKKEDRRDPHKTYHKMGVAKLKKLAPALDWDVYLRITGVPTLPYTIVMQPEFFAALSKMWDEKHLEDWKVYVDFHLISSFSSLLSDAFVKETFRFYGTTLTGTKHMRPLWRRILATVNGHLGEPLGQIYVKKYFSPEAKKKMNLIVDDLFTVYERRIKALDWMGAATKKKALLKLKALNRKIGYPDKWKSYRGLSIKPDDYVGNVLRSNEFEHKREIKKLSGPIDRTEWFMYPQTVNAYFAPNLNDIAFPAAILQPPFFNLKGDDAYNYGCIGMTIGHEITHGFDDEGSKFDAKGNLKSWWTAQDRARFEKKAEVVRKQFDKYTVADGVKVNGKLTLGENIADLGGLSIAYDAYQLHLQRTGRKDIDGLTPEQRFFLGFALFERENVRPEFEKTMALTDPHAPNMFRINGPVSNFDAFYEAYGLKKGDTLYRTLKDREMVW